MFLVKILLTGSGPFSLVLRGANLLPGKGGLTPLTLITSPVLLRGLGGGGRRRGSVGLSDGSGLVARRAVGGVIGRGTRRGGDGDGGLGRTRVFVGGDDTFVFLARGRGGEYDLDLKQLQ